MVSTPETTSTEVRRAKKKGRKEKDKKKRKPQSSESAAPSTDSTIAEHSHVSAEELLTRPVVESPPEAATPPAKSSPSASSVSDHSQLATKTLSAISPARVQSPSRSKQQAGSPGLAESPSAAESPAHSAIRSLNAETAEHSAVASQLAGTRRYLATSLPAAEPPKISSFRLRHRSQVPKPSQAASRPEAPTEPSDKPKVPKADQPVAVNQKSNLRRVCITVAGVLAVIVIIVILLSIGKAAIGSVHVPANNTSCTSAACAAALAQFRLMRNIAYDPCDSLYMYACSGWLMNNPRYSTYQGQLEMQIIQATADRLQNKQLESKDTEPYWNAVMYYRSCLDFIRKPPPTGLLVNRSLELLDLNLTKWLARNDSVSLFFLVFNLSLGSGVDTFYKIEVWVDNKEPAITIRPGWSAGMTLSLIKNSDVRDSYLANILRLIAPSLLTDSLRTALLKYDNSLTSLYPWLNSTELKPLVHGSLMSLQDLPTIPGVLHWLTWKDATNEYINSSKRLSNNSSVVVYGMDTLRKLTQKFFEQEPNNLVIYIFMHVLTNLLRFQFDRSRLDYIPCMHSTSNYFPSSLIHFVYDVHNGMEASASFDTFVEGIRTKLIEDVSSSSWIAQTTRTEAAAKLRSMKVIVLRKDVYEESDSVPLMKTDFLQNYIAITRYVRTKGNNYARENILESDFRYHYSGNTLHIANFMLIEPTFYKREELFVNYATVGARIAAEMSLALSKNGSVYRSDGKQELWWDEKTADEYQKAVSCYGEQVNDSRLESGRLFATARGLHLALSWSSLPGNGADVLFFGRYCQQFCRADYGSQPADLPAQLLCDFAVMNEPKFFEAFHCGRLSKLFKNDRCKVL
ncbi:endothelin-converting enzyme homolog [Ornithodoros turicata]|uniref:endothelin-converting enzyme homolog n=1 Tax=Ornithodoros turicata TaxID=34597 RepID=UPI0031391918